MQIKFLWLLFTIAGIAVAKSILQSGLENRQIKFESYLTGKEFKEKLRAEFTNGINLDYVKKVLEQSGAKCKHIINFKDKAYHRVSPKSKFELRCTYISYSFSTTPMVSYDVFLEFDQANRITHCTGMRITEFLFQ